MLVKSLGISTFARMIFAAQIRAARALLGWNQEELADRAGIGIATIRRLEVLSGSITGNISTETSIRSALEKAGIQFIEPDGQGGIGVRHADLGRSKHRSSR